MTDRIEGLKIKTKKTSVQTPPFSQENTLSEGLLSQQFEDWHEWPLRNHPQNYWQRKYTEPNYCNTVKRHWITLLLFCKPAPLRSCFYFPEFLKFSWLPEIIWKYHDCFQQYKPFQLKSYITLCKVINLSCACTVY